MRTLSSNFQAASHQIQTSEVFITLLEVIVYENDGTTTILRYANNNESITSNGNIYDKAAFELELAGDAKDTTPQAVLKFDSGDRDIIRKIREVNKRPEVNLSVVLASNPDYVEIGPINHEVEAFQMSDSIVSMTLVVEPILNEPIPADVYTPKLFSGLWGSISITSVPRQTTTPPNQEGDDNTEVPNDPVVTEELTINATECWPGDYGYYGINMDGTAVQDQWTYDQHWPRFGSPLAHGALSPDKFKGARISRITVTATTVDITMENTAGYNSFKKIVSADGVQLNSSQASTHMNSLSQITWSWKDLSTPFFSTWYTEPAQTFTVVK